MPAMQESWVWSLGKWMATFSSILAWRIPWTEEPGGLQSVGSQRVGLGWATITIPGCNPLCVPACVYVWLVAKSCLTLQPHELYLARLLCPWNFSGKNTGEGCHFPILGDLLHPRIEPVSLVSLELTGGFFFYHCPTWKALWPCLTAFFPLKL